MGDTPASPPIPPALLDALSALQSHEEWRAKCLNLVASENAVSRTVLALRGSDLEQRYGNYAYRDPDARSYKGTKHIVELERNVEQLAKKAFGAESVELRAISGQIAGAGILAALLKPNDVVLELSKDAGGHRLAGRMAETPLLRLQVVPLAFDPSVYNIDASAAVKQIERLRPRAVVLGSSLFLFPHPVRSIGAALKDNGGGTLIYDGSHVLGLIAGRTFQDPLSEGAEILFGSTHKTLPGPQGGIVVGRDQVLIDRVSRGIYPALVTNHHLDRLPGLAIAIGEMLVFGREYAVSTIRNAQALARALASSGLPVVGDGKRHTESHTVLLRTDKLGSASDCATRLESAGIVTTVVQLPPVLGTEGLRLGTAEITRKGAEESDMAAVGALVTEALSGTESRLVRDRVEQFVSSFRELRFSLDGLLPRS